MRTESFETSDGSTPAFLSPTRNPPRDLKSRYMASSSIDIPRSSVRYVSSPTCTSTTPGATWRVPVKRKVLSCTSRFAQGARLCRSLPTRFFTCSITPSTLGCVSRRAPSQSLRTTRERYCCKVALARNMSGDSSSNIEETPELSLSVASAAATAATSQRAARMGPPPNENAQPGPEDRPATRAQGCHAGVRRQGSGGRARRGNGHGDAVAAEAFGFVQCGVSLLHQARHVLRVDAQGGDADRYRHRERLAPFRPRQRRERDGAPQLFGHLERFRLPHARQHDVELLAAIPRHQVDLADVAPQRERHAAQHAVAEDVAVLIIDLLEEIEIDHQQRKRVAEAHRARELLLQPQEELPPVRDPRTRIGERKLQRLLVEPRIGDGQRCLRREGLGQP